MTAPEDPNGLREALADKALRKEVRDCIGETIPLRRRWVSALVAGPIARLIAERDAAVAGLAQANANIEKLSAAIHDAAPALEARALAAKAEITRLKEGMEARERALGLALRFVDLAAGEGLSFDADGSRPAMDAADVCFAVAEALGIEDLDSDAYRALVARSALATLSPKEQP